MDSRWHDGIWSCADRGSCWGRARRDSLRCGLPICCATLICCPRCRSPRRFCCAIGLRTWHRSSADGWVTRSSTAGSGRMAGMTLGKTSPVESTQWLPAERLGQLSMDGRLRPWLIGKGLLTLRLKAACGERFALRVVDQWTGLLNAEHRSSLRVEDNAGLFRDVEMLCGE